MDFKYDICVLKQEIEKMIDEISSNLFDRFSNKDVVYTDITNCVKFFKHLEIDSNYKIMVKYQYCGVTLFGEVFAVSNEINMCDKRLENCHEYHMNFEKDQYPPEEVIFCDGTPEGYLEAVIFKKVLAGFSGRNSNCLNDFVFANESIKESSKPLIIEPNNWLPKFYKDIFDREIILTYEYDYWNCISICEYIFLDGNRLDVSDFNRRYVSHVPEFNNRFSNNKQCCITKENRVVIRDGDREINNVVY